MKRSKVIRVNKINLNSYNKLVRLGYVVLIVNNAKQGDK